MSLWGDGSWRAQSGLEPNIFLLRLFTLLFLLLTPLWPAALQAQQGDSSETDDHRFDIGIIIDNRPLPRSDAAKAEVDSLLGMLDQQMFIEHVMVFERPSIEVICDVFGCPETIEDANPFPPLIWQITREEEARLFVYYIGDGRIEGLERQLLFRRTDNDDAGDVVALSVEWLHAMLEEAGPASAVLMLDTSFSPRPLPCADEDPLLINDALLSVRSAYRNVMRAHWNRSDVLELSATTPVQPPHCDRFDQVLDEVEQPLFTKFLLKAIVDGEADLEPFGDQDRLIDLGELADYLDDRIRRAARFQWGRLQNVRAIGPQGKALAALDGRELSLENRDVIKRRNQPPAEDEGQGTGTVLPAASPENGGEGRTGAEPKDREALCLADPTAADCHPCVIDPSGPACAERCLEDGGADLCAPNLSSTTERIVAPNVGQPGTGSGTTDVIPIEDEGSTAEEDIGEPPAVCRWVVDQVAPYAAILVARIRGSTDGSCGWATDRSEVDLGPFAQIFTPIAWRLGRESAQDAVSCLLACDSTVISEDAGEKRAAAGEDSTIADPPAAVRETRTRQRPQIPVDPRMLSAFNREICNELEEPLPPYIGLPRWMPGTLIISEALRAIHGCPRKPGEPELPVPFAVAIEAPADVEAPASDQAPAVASADRELSKWPPSTAGIDPLSEGADQEPGSTVPGTGIADATPTSPVTRGEPLEDLPEQTLSFEEEFDPTASKVRWLQSALTVDNRHPGPIDGTIGAKTEAAIRSWRRDNERQNRTGPLTEPEFQEIIREFGERFGQIEERVQSF